MYNVIFDTDLGGDCDDVLALDLIIASHKKGECNLISVTYSADARAAIPCIYAILRRHGLESVPIASAPVSIDTETKYDCYASKVASAFPYENAPSYESVPRAVSLLRRLLSQSDLPVKLIVTGFLTNIAALLESGADGVSPLDGISLMREKVAEISIMGGDFSHISCVSPSNIAEDGTVIPTPEWNIKCDVGAAQTVFSLCPCVMTLLPFEAGLDMISGADLVKRGGMNSPDSYAYIVHGSQNGRHSWDPATALYALYGAKPWFFRSTGGIVTVKTDGVTDFTVGGNTHLLECALPKIEIAAEIDRLVSYLFLCE